MRTTPYTADQLLGYTTLRSEKCWIRDVMTMDIAEGKDCFMLGRVPCRNAEILGLCVGAQEYEQRWKILGMLRAFACMVADHQL